MPVPFFCATLCIALPTWRVDCNCRTRLLLANANAVTEGAPMALISIANCLWFEETPLGATLNFRSSETVESILFRVGISHESLQECSEALRGLSCLWAIKDGSLTVYGDGEEL